MPFRGNIPNGKLARTTERMDVGVFRLSRLAFFGVTPPRVVRLLELVSEFRPGNSLDPIV